MCGGVHYGEVEGLVSVERWSCSRGASCVVECREYDQWQAIFLQLCSCSDVHEDVDMLCSGISIH